MLIETFDHDTTVAEPRWTRRAERVSLSTAERAALWRQRLFEAEAGMTRLLAGHATDALIAGWLRTRSELFADLPADTDGDVAGWQAIFFRAQALMERFLVRHLGHDALRDWAGRNAEVYALVEGDPGGGALDPITRLAKQAELYGSRYAIVEDGPHEAAIAIEHCAIWDYRERARARGVQLTLASPCEYCTKATTANIRAQGCVPAHELTDGPDGPGCRWRATATAAVSSTGEEA